MSAVTVACPTPGHGTHGLTAGEAERLIYALTAAFVDARTEPLDDPQDDDLPCPLEILSWSWEAEMYCEHADAWVRARRRQRARS